MIQFPCTCDHLFTVDDDRVGEDIQCPDCGKLNSVPTAADLDLINNDGTYRVDGIVAPEQPNAEREAELKRIFVKGRQDEYGNDIDLRSHATPLDYRRVGVDPIELTSNGDRPAAPKYDPETGELIRPMEIRKEPLQPVRRVMPASAIRPLRRRKAVQRLTSVSPINIARELLKPTNITVMAIVIFAHVGLQVIGMFPILGILALLIGTPALWTVMIMHLGNVIDETGPSSRDELPRPLRDLNWVDDMWSPLRAVILTLMLCYGPSVFFISSHIADMNTKLILAGGWAVFGTAMAPVVLLIAATSGSIANLRPDRVLGTMRVMGASYPLILILMLVSIATYIYGYFAFSGSLMTVGHIAAYRAPLTLMSLILGIFLLHHFCWTMGHVYRVYHARFPWAYQGMRLEDELESRGFQVINPQKPAPATPAAPLPAIALGPVTQRVEPLDPIHHHP